MAPDHDLALNATLRQPVESPKAITASTVASIRLKNTVRAHQDAVANVRPHPQSSVVASVGDDGLAKLWTHPRFD